MDLEQSTVWLHCLTNLILVITAAGLPLYGNLFYDDPQADYVDRTSNVHARPKRDRFLAALRCRTLLLEVEVNGCHSA